MLTKYQQDLNIYRAQVASLSSITDDLRIETQFESLEDRSLMGSLTELEQWFLDQQQRCQMTIEDIALRDCRGWLIDKDTGWISHESGEFFVIQGVRVGFSDNREVVGGWDQPILTQIGFNGGLLGLLRKRFGGIPHYLIEAKAEPGNPDKIQISPTLQATFSNLNQAHGGRKPKFSQYFEIPEKHDGKVLFSQWMSEDGGRLNLKRNKGMLVELPEGSQIELPDNFYWTSLFQLKALIKSNSWVNPHIRGIISSL
jgi:oxidase EvaA